MRIEGTNCWTVTTPRIRAREGRGTSPNKIERHFAFEVRLATPNRTFRTSAHIGGFKRICYAEALCLNHHVCSLREKRRG
jgi:hypothetical protein